LNKWPSFCEFAGISIEIIKEGIKRKRKNAQKAILTIGLNKTNRKRNLNLLKLA
jgi:hypothetical protein